MMLRQWCSAPLVDTQAICNRLDAIEYLVGPERDQFHSNLQSYLRGIADVARIFTRIKSRCASLNEWKLLSQSISSYLAITTLLRDAENSFQDPALPGLLKPTSSQSNVIEVSNLLNNIIDFEGSMEEASIVIRAGVSNALDAARQTHDDLDNVLTEVAHQIQEKEPSLSSMTVQYIPQVGYVVCCDSPTTLPDFVFQFQEDDTTFYYKESCCRDLDESVGDIFGLIQDLQRELLEELVVALLHYEHALYEMIEVTARFDCFIALADAARCLQLKRPLITDENEFVVKAARHPLQELIVDNYISNDVALDTSRPILLITGQNGSGKSVVLKMVGLIQYMAQIGVYVPADEARVGVVRKMFTRIHSFETASASQSSFTIDCNQISRMLRHGRERSLFLIDEFGKGTADADGSALLAATVNYIATLSISQMGPRAVITTHLLDIFRSGFVRGDQHETGNQAELESSQIGRRSPIACATMASISTNEGSQSIRVFAPMHELQPGISKFSNALGCASTAGIPSRIIQRAAHVLERYQSHKSIEPITSNDTSLKAHQQLLARFSSVEDWTTVSTDTLQEFLAAIKICESRLQ
ncbi:hypothetical protein PINS_up015199 [Pythium insidiosum]|nr:hypothetical protein PINS_up015199 [Pythium insidiosum]